MELGRSLGRSPMMPSYGIEEALMFPFFIEYCLVSRDVFLSSVVRKQAKMNYGVSVRLHKRV